jgi:tRNA pseudouridine-54 N-methylase
MENKEQPTGSQQHELWRSADRTGDIVGIRKARLSCLLAESGEDASALSGEDEACFCVSQHEGVAF